VTSVPMPMRLGIPTRATAARTNIDERRGELLPEPSDLLGHDALLYRGAVPGDSEALATRAHFIRS